MIEVLAGQDLYASAPSWDGHWLSLLLRAAGLPRHALRLRDTKALQRETANAILDAARIPENRRAALVDDVLAAARRSFDRLPPAHRALEDARRELRLWQEIRRQAKAMTTGSVGGR
jgi:hypothetical protein